MAWCWRRARDGIGEGRAATIPAMIDIGGYYHFKHHPGEQFLFCYGHSVAGQTENYAYAGMYWTWGKDDKKTASRKDWMQGPMTGNGFE